MNVTIIGGGVSGLTTGLLLRIFGYETMIYDDNAPIGKQYYEKDPMYPSSIAAASIIPHTVTMNNLLHVLQISQEVFRILNFSAAFGVRMQRHYEIFETSTPIPEYAPLLDGFAELNDKDWCPRRKNAGSLYGWYFTAYFAEMPLYLTRLYELYQKLGGKIRNKRIEKEDIDFLADDVVINCLGLGTYKFFKDEESYKVVRGKILHVDIEEIPKTPMNTPFSYNYTPSPEVYSLDGKNPADVYCYPRLDGWILGGTREEGVLDEEGEWIENISTVDQIDMGGTQIPRAILDVNMKIMENATNIDCSTAKMKAMTGYRFERQPVRLEKTTEFGKTIIHNYGHGGAGITLSWGCAFEVLQLVRKKLPIENEELPEIAVAERAVIRHIRRIMVRNNAQH